ncbi:hypothetical protein D3C75_906340 [compost metagenome]
MAGPARPKIRQEGFNYGHCTKHVDLKLVESFTQRRFFHNPFVAITGIIDQNVDSPQFLLYGIDQWGNRSKVSDIENAAKAAARRQGFEFIFGLLVA